MNRLIRHLLLLVCYGLMFSFIGGLAAFIYLKTRTTLFPWHTVELREEYKASRAKEIPGFDAYVKLEDRLFEELRSKIYLESPERGRAFHRYTSGSRTDPLGYDANWNRSYELPTDNPRGGVLMLHGLSDSPYSLRVLAQFLHGQGFWVVGLRMPGHGTAPSGLVHAEWEDWAAATRLGARRVRERIGTELPFYLAGYSNGAALAVEYALDRLSGGTIPAAEGLILLSPAIGVKPVAALAGVQSRLAQVPGLGKLHWESVMPEFDPYKYNSFAVNAGTQIYRLTNHIATRLDSLERDAGTLESFPRTIVFQSVVDATIPPEAILEKLLRRLPPGSHELVLFDVNREARAEDMLLVDPDALTFNLLKDASLSFDITFVTNMHEQTDEVHVVRRRTSQSPVEETPLQLAWPRGIYSLSHIAIPFPREDPLYGVKPPPGAASVNLGGLELRGERGVLSVLPSHFLRLRYNPFFPYVEKRVKEFVENDRVESGVGGPR